VTDERTRRVGMNEAVFREVNERLEELAGEFGVRDERLELICECGNLSCADRIRMSAEEYEELRRDPTRFAIVPGHEIAEVESVVAHREGYSVVRKLPGTPAAVAEDTNPRD
jgi:hypothetical protein